MVEAERVSGRSEACAKRIREAEARYGRCALAFGSLAVVVSPRLLFGILVAVLVVAIVVSGVVLVQALAANLSEHERVRMRAIAELAQDRGGRVTPWVVSEHLGITPLEADRLLRAMVDDEHLLMGIDDDEGVLVFEFPKLASGRGQSTARR